MADSETTASPPRVTADTTIAEVQQHLRNAHARIGFAGRFAFTIDQFGEIQPRHGFGGCYITHWFRPTSYAFEDCKAVGSGSVEECINALDTYVEKWRDCVGAKSEEEELVP
jgi:hypothetical protein